MVLAVNRIAAVCAAKPLDSCSIDCRGFLIWQMVPPDLRAAKDDQPRRRRMEIIAFLIVTAVLMPGIAVATVGTWGLTVWLYQIVNGPPGPPRK